MKSVLFALLMVACSPTLDGAPLLGERIHDSGVLSHGSVDASDDAGTSSDASVSVRVDASVDASVDAN